MAGGRAGATSLRCAGLPNIGYVAYQEVRVRVHRVSTLGTVLTT